jgi:Putative restriction endonuclease/Periplasmic binding protein-like domain
MGSVNVSNHVFVRQFDDVAIVSIQNTVRIPPRNMPQPDIALLRRRDDWYRKSHSTPEDVYLVVEIADSSLSYDRDVKAPLTTIDHPRRELGRLGIETLFALLDGEPPEVLERVLPTRLIIRKSCGARVLRQAQDERVESFVRPEPVEGPGSGTVPQR